MMYDTSNRCGFRRVWIPTLILTAVTAFLVHFGITDIVPITPARVGVPGVPENLTALLGVYAILPAGCESSFPVAPSDFNDRPPGDSLLRPLYPADLYCFCFCQDGSMLEQVVGTLGVVETWFLIVYGLTDYAPFTSFEKMIFSVLARFELAGYMAVLYSWFRILRGYGSSTTSFDGKDNSKTFTRDALHNLVYPRSEPGSRIRREFAAIAWVGVLVGGLPVLVVLPLYPVWGTTADTPDYLSLVPLALGVIAIVEILAGSVYLSTNRSSYVATVLYLNAKVTSLVILVCGYDRLLGGSEWGGNFPTGGFLAVLQVVKISSAVVALGGYIRGRPDEGMPNCNATCRSCRAFCCK